MIGFGAGKENPHGVRAVTRGQRCAVALWFTLDPAHEEKVRASLHKHVRKMSVGAKFALGPGSNGLREIREVSHLYSHPFSSNLTRTQILFPLQERIQAQQMLKMFSAPVNQEFFGNAEGGASASPLQADQVRTKEKHKEKPEKKQPEAAADVQDDKLSKVKAEKKQPAGKAKAGSRAKAAPKAKDPAKAKTKAKQADKKGSKSAAKRTVQGGPETSKAGSAAVSGPQDSRDEL